MQTEQYLKQANNRSGEEIISGAGNDDQLDKLRPDQENKEAEQNGTPPSTGDEHLQAAKTTDKGAAEKNNADAAQETTADKNGDANNLGGATNLTIDQLKHEGDNNQ